MIDPCMHMSCETKVTKRLNCKAKYVEDLPWMMDGQVSDGCNFCVAEFSLYLPFIIDSAMTDVEKHMYVSCRQ